MTGVEAGAATITSIQPDSRGAGAARVHVDGGWYCTIPQRALEQLALRPGLVLTPELKVRLTEAADAQAAYRYVLAALARRGFARRDLERRMIRRGHPRGPVAQALDRAQEAGLIDDRAFAECYARSRVDRGRGPARVLRDLMAMGVEQGTAQAAIDAAWNESGDPAAAALAIAARRGEQLGDLPLPVKRRRLLAYLARRGFQGPEVRQIVSQVLAVT